MSSTRYDGAMITVSNCPICDGRIRRLRRALVAPFLAQRIWGRKPFAVELDDCKTCGFRFYNPRLDDGDMQKLYEGYRSEKYWQERNSFEPWYSRKLNFELASPASYEKRRAVLRSILERHLNGRKIKRIPRLRGRPG